MKEEKKTVILVSHSMDSVRSFSDRALLLDKGKIVKIGDPDDVSDEYVKRNIEREYASKTNQKGEEKDKKNNNKPVTVTSVKILDKQDKEISNFTGGDSLTIQVCYKVNKKIDELNVGIGLHSEANGYVFGYNTKMDKVKVRHTAKGSVVLRFDSLPILNGSYFMNIVCFGNDESVPYDFKPKALNFSVSNVGASQTYRGVVAIDHSWDAKE